MYQLMVYPYVATKFGLLKTFKYNMILFLVVIFLIPNLSLLQYQPSIDSAILTAVEFNWTVYILLVILISCMSISAQTSFAVEATMINNSCYMFERGVVNGVAQSYASFGRLITPYSMASLFAWSATNSLSWPFNYFFCWYIMLIVGYFTLVLGNTYLKEDIEKRKPESEEIFEIERRFRRASSFVL